MNRPKSAPSRKPKAPPRRAAPAVSDVAVPPVAVVAVTSAERPAEPPAERIEPAGIAEPRGPASIDLALQGGGSHGAFTWGVLDALLEDGRLGLDGVSGTSAGAMNAAVLACGFARGGREGARAALRAFWNDIGSVPGCLGAAPVLPSLPAAAAVPAVATGLPGWPMSFASPFASPFVAPFSRLPHLAWPAWLFNTDIWPMYGVLDAMWRSLSPYQFNPLNLNPLRRILEKHVDPVLLRDGPLKVFVTATAVSTGQPRVFSGAELSIDALLASACLPQMYQAIEIGGESYWDGGFAGNPAIWPLIYGTGSLDVLLVQINPLVRPGVPTRAVDIADRVNEITFNASLVAEMRAIAFVQKLVRQQKVSSDEYKLLRLHRVADEDGLAPYDASSKLNTDPRLLQALFDLGRAAAGRWLAEHAGDVGVRGTTEIEPVFLAPRPVPAGT